MYDRREHYPNSPLALVTAEVRYPYAPRLRQLETIDRIQLALEEFLPIRKTESRIVVQLGAGQVSPNSVDVYRFLNRSASWSAVVSPEAFTVETTRYEGFDDLLKFLVRVGEAINAVTPIPALERVGLRYIDEIRVPGRIEAASDWSAWVSPGLVLDLDAGLGSLQGTQGVGVYDLGEGAHLQFQYAAAVGPGIVGNDPLKRKNVPDVGPFFLLDLDSFWQAPSPEESKEFSTDFLESVMHRLHDPTGVVFQAAITERLRELFRESP